MSSSNSYYYSSTTSSTTRDGATTTSGHRQATTSHRDREGVTTVRSAHQDLGQPAVVEERQYDRAGHEFLPATSLAGGVRTITEEDDEHPPSRQSKSTQETQSDEPSYSQYHPLMQASWREGGGTTRVFDEDAEASELI